MNKQILSIFVLCAFSYSTQAQEVKGGISDSMMQQIKQSYANTPTDKAIRNAIGNNDIRKLALNQDNLKGMDTPSITSVPSNSRKLILSSSTNWRKPTSFCKVLSIPAVSRWMIKWWNGSSVIL